MVETDLYFGLSKPDGAIVSNKEWEQFKADHISTVFKEGSTVLDAAGSWRDTRSGQFTTEQTRIVIYIHKNSKRVSKQIDSLSNIYKTLFKQQSVLRVDKKVKVTF